MTNYLINLYDKQISNVFSNKKNLDTLIKYISNYIDKNNEILYYNTPTYRLIFSDVDREIIFTLTEINKDEIYNEIKKIDNIFPNLADIKAVIYDPFNILMVLIIRNFFLKKNEKIVNLLLTYLSLNFYSSLHFKYYRYPPNDNVMQYTINRISNKFLFKQYGVVIKALFHTVETNHNSFKNTYLKNGDDLNLIKYLSSLRSRLNNQMKAFAVEYFKDLNAGNYLNKEEESRDEEDYHEVENLSGKIVNFANKVSITFFSIDISQKILDISAGIAGCDKLALKNSLISIKLKEREKVNKLILSIIQCYLKDKNNTFDSMTSKKFFTYCNQIYIKSNTKDQSIILIKKILDEFLKEHCDKYNKTEREATKNNYRRGLYLYFVLLINTINNIR